MFIFVIHLHSLYCSHNKHENIVSLMHILINHIVSLIAQKYTLTKYLQKLNIYDLSTSTLCSKEMNQMSFDAINDQERWDRKNGKERKNKYSNAKIQLCVLKRLFCFGCYNRLETLTIFYWHLLTLSYSEKVRQYH